VGLAGPEATTSHRYLLPGNSADVRQRAVGLALDWLRRALLDGA
jgi:hypothetical protein